MATSGRTPQETRMRRRELDVRCSEVLQCPAGVSRSRRPRRGAGLPLQDRQDHCAVRCRRSRRHLCPIHRPALPERYCCPRSSPTVPEPWLPTFRLSNWERKIPASACCDSGSGTACGPCTPRSAGRGSRNSMKQHVRDNHDKAVRSQASLAAARMACALTWNELLE